MTAPSSSTSTLLPRENVRAAPGKGAALLVGEVFPEQPERQWVLSVPYPLRLLFDSRPAVTGRALGIVYRCMHRHALDQYGGLSP